MRVSRFALGFGCFLAFLIVSFGGNVMAMSIAAPGNDFFPRNQSSLRNGGITYDSHPMGTSGVQFNLFTDDSFYAQLKRQVTLGLNREASIDQAQSSGKMKHLDERDFSAIRRVHPDIFVDEDIPYVNGLYNLDRGETIKVMTLVHNNAKQVCGGGNFARNTVVEVNWSDPSMIVSSISASNATPKKINDPVKVSYKGDYTLEMLSATLIERIDPDGTPTGVECGSTNQGWRSRAVASNTNNIESARFNFGNVAGSYGSMKVLVTQFRVVEKDRSFQITKTSTPPNNTTIENGDMVEYSITVKSKGDFPSQNVVLEDDLGSNLRYVSGDPGVEPFADLCVDPGPDTPQEVLDSGYFGCYPSAVRLNFGTVDGSKTLSFKAKAHVWPHDGSELEVCNRIEFDGEMGMRRTTSNRVCLDVEIPAACGDGKVDSGEVCDDGNTTDGDTCSGDCQTKGECGNGIIDQYEVQCVTTPCDPIQEVCDDGNTIDGDGCSADCTGTQMCGDGICESPETPESCPQDCGCIPAGGTVTNADTLACCEGLTNLDLFVLGDLPSCTLDPSGTVCGNCGDGVCGPGENLCNCPDDCQSCGDGICSADEDATSCYEDCGQCGNGTVEGPEVCDDGNTEDGDECSADCSTAAGCGDGVIQEDEGCDDGNTDGGDGCSARCQVEVPGGGGGGGGSAPVNPQVGTCVIHENRGPQCVPRYPDRRTDPESYADYEACLNKEGRSYDGYSICLRYWARNKGLPVCGWVPDTNRPLEIAIPHQADPQIGLLEPQCNIIPEQISCHHCPGCFGTVEVKKEIKRKNGEWSDQANIVRGDEVEYQLTLTLGDFDKPNQRILSGDVTFYDITIPAESGNIWNRKGIGGVRYSVVNKHFDKIPIRNIRRVNQGKAISETIKYTMDSELAIDEDIAQLKNVAFAMVDYRYEIVDADGKKEFKTRRVGFASDPNADICSALSDRNTNEVSTLGSIATANVIRPFIDAKSGGNIGFENIDQNENSERVTGNVESIQEEVNGDDTVLITSGRIYIPDENNGAFDFRDQVEQENLEEIDEFAENSSGNLIDNLRHNREAEVELDAFPGVTLNQSPDEANIYFRNGSISLDKGVYDLEGESVTIIVQNGNLVLHGDFEVVNGFIAFVLVNGNVILESDVRKVDGIFLTEKGYFEGEESSYQLQVSGAFIGDTYRLLKNRNYIGTDPDQKLEPNVRFLFDIRMVEETPPGLEQFLGEGWSQVQL